MPPSTQTPFLFKKVWEWLWMSVNVSKLIPNEKMCCNINHIPYFETLLPGKIHHQSCIKLVWVWAEWKDEWPRRNCLCKFLILVQQDVAHCNSVEHGWREHRVPAGDASASAPGFTCCFSSGGLQICFPTGVPLYVWACLWCIALHGLLITWGQHRWTGL